MDEFGKRGSRSHVLAVNACSKSSASCTQGHLGHFATSLESVSQERLGEISGLHRNPVGAVERAGRTPSIVAADRLAGLFAELERGTGG